MGHSMGPLTVCFLRQAFDNRKLEIHFVESRCGAVG